MDAGETAAGQYHRFLASLHQAFIHGFVHQQRIDITHLFPTPLAVIHTTTHQVIVLGLRSVLPPGINTQRQQPLAEVLPIRLCGLRIKEVYPVGAGDVIVVANHLTPYVRVLVYLRPHAKHQSDAQLVQRIGQRLGVGIILFIELHRVPAVLTPVLPVLHNHADGHPFLLEATCCLQDFL